MNAAHLLLNANHVSSKCLHFLLELVDLSVDARKWCLNSLQYFQDEVIGDVSHCDILRK